MSVQKPCTVVPYAAEHLEDISLIDRICFIDPWFKRAFIEELTAPCALNLIAVSHDSKNALGFCLARVITDECTINRLAVHPDYQRSGIASWLLKIFLQRAACRGARNCFIDVRAGNTAAHCLYEKHGFYRIGVRKAYYRIKTEDAIMMQCALADCNYREPL